MLFKNLLFEIFSLIFNVEVIKIKLIPQIKIPGKMKSDFKMPSSFNGEIIEKNTAVITKIATIAVMLAILISFILN